MYFIAIGQAQKKIFLSQSPRRDRLIKKKNSYFPGDTPVAAAVTASSACAASAAAARDVAEGVAVVGR